MTNVELQAKLDQLTCEAIVTRKREVANLREDFDLVAGDVVTVDLDGEVHEVRVEERDCQAVAMVLANYPFGWTNAAEINFRVQPRD
jgi:hypothetical protein